MRGDGPAWLAEWRRLVLEAADFACEPMALAESADWRLRDGQIRHRTGRFFSVVGVEDSSGRSFPLIHQPEVGTLGFLVAGPPGRTRWLTQMKIEPGNVGAAQLAPTLQATQSNLDRVHRGWSPVPADRFPGSAPALADGLWSEQGSRFLGKRNRNVTVAADPPQAETLRHRWVESPDLREALGSDFAVNTDARSVIATAPWRLVGGVEPFTGGLRRSYLHHEAGALRRAAAAVESLPSAELRRVPLEALTEAVLDPGTPTPLRHPHFDVVHRMVRATTREVTTWDQPLAKGTGRGRIELRLAACPDGVLRAELAIDRDPGLIWGAELTASAVTPAGSAVSPWSPGRALARVLVSDEGGRFDHEVSEVRIIETDGPLDEDAPLLTLGDLERLVRRPMATTNELRTAVAVLLSLA